MRTLLSIAALLSVAMPALAVDPTVNLPEPGSFALLGIAGVAGLLVHLRGKK